LITFPIEHFDIYFRHYLRRRRLSCAEYAELIGQEVRTVEGVAEGRLTPTMKILNDMGVTIRSTKSEKCTWNIEREVQEI
jgi:hypothetical protein